MDKTSTLGDRIAGIRKNLGLTQDSFANAIGITRPMVGAWERNKSEPNRQDLVKISILGKVTFDWLLMGVESSFKPPIADINELASNVKRVESHYYPVINRVTAGDYQSIIDSEGDVKYYPIEHYRKDCFLVEVEGDSMISPNPNQLSIHPGDRLLVSPSDYPNPGDIVIVGLNSGRQMCKRFFRKDNSIIELRSQNPDHPTIYSSEDQVDYLFRVIFHQPQGKKL